MCPLLSQCQGTLQQPYLDEGRPTTLTILPWYVIVNTRDSLSTATPLFRYLVDRAALWIDMDHRDDR
jgi:hypothetical protein